MTVSWMLYALIIGALVGATATGLESLLRIGGRPARWVWALALGLTTTLTLVAPRRAADSGDAPVVLRVTENAAAGVKRAPGVVESAALLVRQARDLVTAPFAAALRAAGASTPRWLDRGLTAGWLGLSVALLLIFGAV